MLTEEALAASLLGLAKDDAVLKPKLGGLIGARALRISDTTRAGRPSRDASVIRHGQEGDGPATPVEKGHLVIVPARKNAN